MVSQQQRQGIRACTAQAKSKYILINMRLAGHEASQRGQSHGVSKFCEVCLSLEAFIESRIGSLLTTGLGKSVRPPSRTFSGSGSRDLGLEARRGGKIEKIGEDQD